MKKIIMLLTILALIFAMTLTGCGGSDSASDADQSESEQTEAGADENDQVEEAGTEGLGDLLSGAYVDMMKNKEYLMTYKATMEYEGQSMEVEATIAVKGEDSAMTSKGEGFETAMLFKGDKTYMIDHASKTVTSWGDAGVDMDEMESEAFEADDMTYIGSGTEDGLVYEEYSTSDGNVKYYFDGKDLVKIKTVIEGQEMVMDIIEMSNNVPGNMFEIPAGYQLIEM
jgi:hypothetical protein